MSDEQGFKDGYQPKETAPQTPAPILIVPPRDVGAGYQPTTSEGDNPTGNPPPKKP